MGRLWREATVTDRLRLVAACVLALALVAGFEVQTHRGGHASARASVSLRSPEVSLVTIQLGYRPGPHNGILRHFALVLDILGADCPADTRQGLVDLTTRSLRQLRHAGVPATPNQILGGVLGATDMGSRSECAGFFERYVALRRGEPKTSP